jgi:hypothetical protein
MLKPGYTMAGFNWHDQRGIEGTGFVRSLRTLLTNHLPKMTPDVRRLLEQGFTRELAQGGNSLNGRLSGTHLHDYSNCGYSHWTFNKACYRHLWLHILWPRSK